MADPAFDADLQAVLSEIDAGAPEAQAAPAPTPQQPTPEAPQAQPQAAPQEGQTASPMGGGGPLGTLQDLNRSVGVGAMKSIFETKDFLFGETPEAEKSDLRKGVEGIGKRLAGESVLNGVAMGVSQFATGMIGAGKLTAPLQGIKAVANASKGVKVVGEIAKAAGVGAVVFDPHEERLSNLIQSYPFMANPVNEFLAAKPTDSAAEGRFKNALESVGMDVAAIAIFKASVAGYKYLKAGKTAEANASFAEASKAMQEADAAATVRQGQEAADAGELAVQKGQGPSRQKTMGELFQEFRSGERSAGAETPLQRAQEFQQKTKGAADEAAPRAEPEAAKGGEIGQPAPHPADPQGGNPGAAAADAVPAAPSGLREGAVEAVPNLKAADATLPPGGPKPLAQVPDAAFPEIAGKVAGDVEALIKYGSREKAVAQGGHEFAKGSELPWKMWNTADDVQAFAGRLADYAEGQLKGKRGATSDKTLQRLVNQRVIMFGEKPDDVMGLIQSAGKNAKTLAVNLEASTALGIKMTDEAMSVHAKIRAGNLADWGGSHQAALDEFGKRVGLSLEMLGEARAMASGAGRALRRTRGDLSRISGDELRKLEALPVQALFHLFSEANGDLKTVAKMLQKPGLLAQATDVANFLRVNNLLWGWKTHVVNAVSNAGMMVLRPAERLIGSTILQAGGKLDGSVASSMRTQAVREFRYASSVVWDSLYTALRHWQADDTMKSLGKAFTQGDSVISPHADEYFRQAGRNTGEGLYWKPVENLQDLGNNAIRALEVAVGMPTRVLGVADELMKQISYRSVVMAEASMEADARGLSGSAARRHIESKLDEAFDANGAAVNPAALKEAQVRTFQQDLLPKTWGATIQHAKANHPALGLILPFVKTPTNVLRYSWQLTPGLNMLQAQYREMLSGKLGLDQQAHAVGQMAIGGLLMGAAGSLVAGGKVTGSGPMDAKKKQALMATGWQPNSWVTHNEDGTATYTPFNRFDPIAMVAGIMADISDVVKVFDSPEHPDYHKVERAAGALLMSVVNQLKDRTYLMSLTQALQAANEPDKKGGKFVGSVAGSLVPFATLTRMLSDDPYVREVRGIVDGLRQNTPGLSETLPARRDMWGEEVLVNRGFSTSTRDHIVDNEMVRMGLDFDQAFGPPVPQRAGKVDLRDITLEADLKDRSGKPSQWAGKNAYEVLQELSRVGKTGGKTLKQAAADLFQSRQYKRLADGDAATNGTKQHMVQQLLDSYRNPAWTQLQGMSPKLRERLQEAELRARSAFSAGQKDSQAAGAAKGVQALGAAYGLDLSGFAPNP